MKDPLNRLKDLVGNLVEGEVFFDIEAIQTDYPAFTKIYIPYHEIKKLRIGYSAVLKRRQKLRKISDNSNGDDDYENMKSALNELNAIRRAKKKIREYALMNEFEHFATFTFSPEKVDRYNIELCKQKIHDWFKNRQKRNGKFQYIIVAEYHQDKGVHFHALIKGYSGKLYKSISPKTGRQIINKGQKVFNYPGFKLGFTYIKLVENTSEELAKSASYLYKYVSKDFGLNTLGKKRYWISSGLKKPIVTYNPPRWYYGKKPDWKHQGDFGMTLYFNKKAIE